jgi:hypothetical protein
MILRGNEHYAPLNWQGLRYADQLIQKKNETHAHPCFPPESGNFQFTSKHPILIPLRHDGNANCTINDKNNHFIIISLMLN